MGAKEAVVFVALVVVAIFVYDFVSGLVPASSSAPASS